MKKKDPIMDLVEETCVNYSRNKPKTLKNKIIQKKHKLGICECGAYHMKATKEEILIYLLDEEVKRIKKLLNNI